MEGELVVVANAAATSCDLLTVGCWFGEIGILNTREGEMGNRWTANISYSDQPYLPKEVPLEAVAEHPRGPHRERACWM